ncbi:hypothetical protein VPH35_113207 [Triticum aestivum]
MTCLTECPNQVTVTSSLASPVMTAPLLPATTPVLAIDLIHSATNGDSNLWAPLAMEDELLTMPSPRIFSAINSLQLLMDSGMDVSKPTTCSRFCLPDTTMPQMMAMVFPQIWQKQMRLRLTPWPSFWMDLTDGNELMTPCILQKSSYEFHAQDVQPRFRFSQDNVHLKLSRPSAAICVFCTVLFGNQSMMLHDGLRQGMQHQADQLEETYYANHVLEHASTPDKLQKAMHNLNIFFPTGLTPLSINFAINGNTSVCFTGLFRTVPQRLKTTIMEMIATAKRGLERVERAGASSGNPPQEDPRMDHLPWGKNLMTQNKPLPNYENRFSG